MASDCIVCERAQDEGLVSILRVDEADVQVIGCMTHLERVARAVEAMEQLEKYLPALPALPEETLAARLPVRPVPS